MLETLATLLLTLWVVGFAGGVVTTRFAHLGLAVTLVVVVAALRYRQRAR